MNLILYPIVLASMTIHSLALLFPKKYIQLNKKLTPRHAKRHSYMIDIEAGILLLCLIAVFICPVYQVPLYGALAATQIYWAVIFSVERGLTQLQIFKSYLFPLIFGTLIFVNEYFQFDIVLFLFK